MTKANERQVGGSHYSVNGAKLQHWDVSRIFNLDPMQYQVSKHLFRWKDKFPTFEERFKDLEKTQHYLQKYMEDARIWDSYHVRLPAAHVIVAPRSEQDMADEYEAQILAATNFHPDGFTMEGTRYQCKLCRAVVKAGSPLGALRSHATCMPVAAPAPAILTAQDKG